MKNKSKNNFSILQALIQISFALQIKHSRLPMKKTRKNSYELIL